MKRRTFIGATGTAAAGLLGTGSATASPLDLEDDPLNDIEILTDEYGVSHIYADDEYSLAYGNGYVQARDRLFQMDAIRLVGRGEAAEWIGPGQLASDIQVKRDLYTESEIQRQWEQTPDTLKTWVRAFTDGVNRQLVEMAATGNLPGEFAALGRPPEPWKPTDTIAAINYLIGFFGVAGGNELGNAKSFARLRDHFDDPEDAFAAYEDLNWLEIRDEHLVSIPERDKTVDGGESVLDSFDAVPAEQLEYIDAALDAEVWGIETKLQLPDDLTEANRQGLGLLSTFKFGSNALIASGDVTESGNPMLGCGAQMGYFKPPVPYEIGLHGAGFDTTGIGISAAPALIIGRRPELCWTATSGRDDQIDTIAVELDPEDRHRYRWDGEWHEMETETVVHHPAPAGSALAGEVRAVEQEVARITQEGVEMPVVAWNPDENVAWCQRTTTRYEEPAGALMWAELARSKEREGDDSPIDDFERRLEEFPFTFNFFVVDQAGNIAYIHTGKVPDRPDKVDLRLPRTPKTHAWTETEVGAGLETKIRNPSRGYVVNWNNGPAAGWRAGDKEQNWGSIHRVDVLDHFVRQKLDIPGQAPPSPTTVRDALTRQDVDDIVRLAATHDSIAQHSVDFMIDAARAAGDEQLDAMATELLEWRDAYCSWAATDGVYTNGGMAIWEETRIALQELAFREELDDQVADLEFDPRQSSDPHAADHGRAIKEVTFVDALNLRTNHGWLGETPAERDSLIQEALRTAASTLEERFESADPADWKLPLRKSRFTPLGGAPADEIPMSNRSSYPIVFEMNTGLDGAAATLPPGNSGHLSAPELAATTADPSLEPDRLTNQLGLYKRYEYKPMPVTRQEVEAVAVEAGTLTPTPERSEETRIEETRLDTPVDTLELISELSDTSKNPFDSSPPESPASQIAERNGESTGLE